MLNLNSRKEIRKIEVFKPDITTYRLGYIYDSDWRKYIKQVIRVSRASIVNYKNSIKRTKDIGYYISTTGIYNAKELNKIIRSHWSIENCNHYVRDVALEEDKSRIRKNSGIMARIRSFALNILRFKNKKNIQRALYENCLKANSWIRGFGNIG